MASYCLFEEWLWFYNCHSIMFWRQQQNLTTFVAIYACLLQKEQPSICINIVLGGMYMFFCENCVHFIVFALFEEHYYYFYVLFWELASFLFIRMNHHENWMLSMFGAAIVSRILSRWCVQWTWLEAQSSLVILPYDVIYRIRVFESNHFYVCSSMSTLIWYIAMWCKKRANRCKIWQLLLLL